MNDYVNKNQKKIAIFNSILIVIALIYGIKSLFTYELETLRLVASIAASLALVSGFAYSASGYRKAAHHFYSLFMFLFAISCFVEVVIGYQGEPTTMNYFKMFTGAVSFIVLMVLAFGKNLGVGKSAKFAFIIFGFNFIVFVAELATINDNPAAFAFHFEELVLSILVLIFVVSKYDNKEARGSK